MAPRGAVLSSPSMRDDSFSLKRSVGALLVAPVVVPINLALAVSHGLLWLAALAAQGISAGLAAIGLTPFASVREWARLTAARASTNLVRSATLVRSTLTALVGRCGVVPPRQLLSHTVLGGATRALLVPMFLLVDFGTALCTTSPTREWLMPLGLWLSGALVARSARGVLPGRVGAMAVARTHVGFFTMVWSATPAVMNNNQGIVGGVVALLLGDPDWLGDAMWQMREYADYVHEKERVGELGPRSNMPFGRPMVETTGAIVAGYPAASVDALRTSGFVAGLRAWWNDRAAVNHYLGLYVPFTACMMADVQTFFTRGLLDAPDAQTVTLCEWAVISSRLTDDEKDAALLDVQAVASASIVEFEHYVGLVLPFDGSLDDKAIRRSASGALLDTHTVVPSILDRHAVHVAQSTNAEAYALRTFLWLYRDEAVALRVNHRETTRKFGPAVADRLARSPRYPLASWERDTLCVGGPRTQAEIDGVLLEALRGRGLGPWADRIAARGPSSVGPEARGAAHL